MKALFDIVGDGFFKPLTSQFKTIYLDCLGIIYDTYRSELSYGADREILILKMTDYFDSIGVSDIQFEDDTKTLHDSRAKASAFLRKLREFGWVEYEITNNQMQRIVMPNHAVTLFQTFSNIVRNDEMEYQGEISAIYSMITNEELLERPYPQLLKPVYARTLELFTGLKKLNTSIRKYIDNLTSEKTPEEILHDFFEYHDEIGSKAYHRIKTSENISRFRNSIIQGLQNMRSNNECMSRLIAEYCLIENENDKDIAAEKVNSMIVDIIEHFRSYDEIIEEIDKKHSKYIRNAVERAKFLLMSSNNMEGKISTVLQYLSEQYNRDEQENLLEDAGDDVCMLFNIFPQGFISGESLKAIAISKKITDIDDIYDPVALTDEEREWRRMAIYEKNKDRFSKKNISQYVGALLENKEALLASDIPVNTKRDVIRIIFIALYGHNDRSDYRIVPTAARIEKNGFIFPDFKIERRV